MRHRQVLMVGFSWAAVVVLGSVSAQEPAEKRPIPSEAAQAESLKLAKEIFGQEFVQAKTAEQKKALGAKLLEKAAESKEDAGSYYVLLRLARDVAVAAGDAADALKAVDAMAASYRIDSLAMKGDALTRAARAAGGTKQYGGAAAALLDLVDEAEAKDDFDSAKKLLEAALASARKAADPALIKRIASRGKELERAVKDYAKVKEAIATLQKTPVDPEANLLAGRHYCFRKDAWEEGLPMLALGSDAKLKALAIAELASPANPDGQASLADGWWGQAEANEGVARQQLYRHAAQWYRKALPGLGGLAQRKAEKRVAESAVLTAGAVAAHQGPVVFKFENDRELEEFDFRGAAGMTYRIYPRGGLEFAAIKNGGVAATKKLFSFPIRIETEAFCLPDAVRDIELSFCGVGIVWGQAFNSKTCIKDGKEAAFPRHVPLVPNRLYQIVLAIDADRSFFVTINQMPLFRGRVSPDVPLTGPVVIGNAWGHVVHHRLTISARPAEPVAP